MINEKNEEIVSIGIEESVVRRFISAHINGLKYLSPIDITTINNSITKDSDCELYNFYLKNSDPNEYSYIKGRSITFNNNIEDINFKNIKEILETYDEDFC